MIRTKFGAHVVFGSRNGYGDLARAGMAGVLAVDEGGALTEADAMSPDTVTIYRTQDFYLDAPAGLDQATPAEAVAIADAIWPALRAEFDRNPADLYTVLNEPAAHDTSVMPAYAAFEARAAALAEADGRRLCLLNLAGGTPTLDVWRQYWLPHIAALTARGHVYGRHAYGGFLVRIDQSGAVVPYDDNVGRPFVEADILAAEVPFARMVVTELGFFAGWSLPPVDILVDQVVAYDAIAMRYDNVTAFMLYSLGQWQNGVSNWQDATPALAEYVAATNAAPVPPAQYRKVFHLLPQEMTRAEADVVLDAGAAFVARNSIFRSLDDAVELASLPSTRADSTLYFWWGNRWSLAERERVYNQNVTVVDMPATAPSSPLDGLVLAPLFGEPFAMTSPFNAPREYGNGLHEGIDLDVLSSAVDSLAPVLCAYAGTVDRVRLATGDYFNYVVCRHERNGSPFFTWYAHLDEVFVIAGQSVEAGTPIGEIGATGNASGEHVHFNLQVPGHGLSGYVVPDVVDPAPYMTMSVSLVEVLPYLRGDGRAYTVRAMIGGVEYQEDMHAHFEPLSSTWLQVKNAHFEELWFDVDFVWRGVDTSPGQGRYYALYENGTVGSRWIRRRMAVGERFDRAPFVQFFDKATCAPVSENSGFAPSWIELVAVHATYTFATGLTLTDVLELNWNNNERYYYARGFGLVGWSSSSGDWSAIVNLTGAITEPEVIPCLGM